MQLTRSPAEVVNRVSTVKIVHVAREKIKTHLIINHAHFDHMPASEIVI